MPSGLEFFQVTDHIWLLMREAWGYSYRIVKDKNKSTYGIEYESHFERGRYRLQADLRTFDQAVLQLQLELYERERKWADS